MSNIITVDAGHHGAHYNKGAAPGYYESAVMWDLHLQFAEAIQRYNAAARLTRTKLEDNPSLVDRGKTAAGTAGFISFHSNADDNSDTDYPLAIHYVDDDCGEADKLSMLLAMALPSTVAEVMGTTQPARIWCRNSNCDRDGNGYADDYYGVLRGAHSVGVPGVILECSFHTNPTTAAWLMDEGNRRTLAEALAKTTADFYGWKPVNSPSSSSSSASDEDDASVEVKMLWLSKGDQGAQVKALQALLIGYGYDCGKDGADGIFGPATDSAVRRYQSRNRLACDGIVGDLTWSKLLGE